VALGVSGPFQSRSTVKCRPRHLFHPGAPNGMVPAFTVLGQIFILGVFSAQTPSSGQAVRPCDQASSHPKEAIPQIRASVQHDGAAYVIPGHHFLLGFSLVSFPCSRVSLAISRRRNFWIFPDWVIGNSLTIST